MDTAQFRSNFPEFSDVARYPVSQLTFWSGIAEKMLDEDVWDNMYESGVMLYVAHEVTLAAQNVKVATNGGVPGGASGPMNSKTVGSVSVGYDTTQTAEKDAGWWNLTTYGKQFYRLMRMFGAGAIQL